MQVNLPKHPIYIVSKGRWESRLTAKALEAMGVPYFVVVEAQERDAYASVIDPKRVLVLDRRYQDEYDTCDDLGTPRARVRELRATLRGTMPSRSVPLGTG